MAPVESPERSEAVSAICLVCRSGTHTARQPWLRHCPACGFWSSELWDEERWQRKASDLDEGHRQPGIEALRRGNARRVLTLLQEGPPVEGQALCDIGCGYGWFMEEARRVGFRATGVEPEERIAEAAAARGNRVIVGCFPGCLAAHERFDVITFNDVLEHLPDLPTSLEACHRHLSDGGRLVINIPNSDGVFFRLANFLAMLGVAGPLDRMWQRAFHSPHLSYFNDRNLETLVSRHGFHLVKVARLATLERRGLLSRVRMDKSSSPLTAFVLSGLLHAALPAVALLPKDITLHVYERRAAEA